MGGGTEETVVGKEETVDRIEQMGGGTEEARSS
jgi:hypothetical protein